MATISGDFGTVNIPDFALDSTLQALLAEQNETRAAMQNNTASIDNLGGFVSNTTASTNTGNKIQSGIRSTLIKTQRQAQASSNRVFGVFSRLNKRLERIPGMTGAVQAIRTGDMSSFLNNLGPLGTGTQKVIEVMLEYRASLQNLSNVGLGFGTSILKMQQQLGELGVGLAEFERVVTRNGTAIRNLGENSAMAFAQLSNEVRSAGTQFGNYGLKITEINDFLAENLEIERMMGVQGEKASQNVQSAFNALAKETTLQSIQTGRDRKAMMRAALEARSSENFLAAVRQEEAEGNTEAAKNMRQNLDDVSTTLSAMFGPELAGQLVDSITTGVAEGRGIEATEIGRQFLAAGGPAAEALQKIALNFKDFSPDEVGDLLMDFQDQIEERAEGIKDLGRLANVNEGFGLLRSLFVNLTRVEDLSTEEIEARLKDRAEQNENSTQLLRTENELNNLLTVAQGKLAGAVSALANDFSHLSKKMNDFVAGLTDDIRNVQSFGNAIGEGTSNIIDAATDLESKGFAAAAFGFRQAGKQGALVSAAMSQDLGKKYSISGSDVLDKEGNKLSSTIGKDKTKIFEAADGTKFRVIGNKLVPIKGDILRSVANLTKTGGKVLGGGALAVSSAIDAYGIESGIGGNIDRLKALRDKEGISTEEKTRIEEQIKQEREKYYEQYAQLIDKLIMGGAGASIGSILGGGFGSIPMAIGGSYAGMSLAESGVGPMQWLADMLGIDSTDMKTTDRSQLMKRIKNAEETTPSNSEGEDSVSEQKKQTAILEAIAQATGVTADKMRKNNLSLVS